MKRGREEKRREKIGDTEGGKWRREDGDRVYEGGG